MVSQISDGWCLFVNAAARDAAGTHCHRVHVDGFNIPDENTVIIILPMNQHYVDEHQSMTLSLIIMLYSV